jgi:hypothetical protein
VPPLPRLPRPISGSSALCCRFCSELQLLWTVTDSSKQLPGVQARLGRSKPWRNGTAIIRIFSGLGRARRGFVLQAGSREIAQTASDRARTLTWTLGAQRSDETVFLLCFGAYAWTFDHYLRYLELSPPTATVLFFNVDYFMFSNAYADRWRDYFAPAHPTHWQDIKETVDALFTTPTLVLEWLSYFAVRAGVSFRADGSAVGVRHSRMTRIGLESRCRKHPD